MKTNTVLIFFLLLPGVSGNMFAQQLDGQAQMSEGKSRIFSMGKVPKNSKNAPISVRANQANATSIKKIIRDGGEFRLSLVTYFELFHPEADMGSSIQLKGGNQCISDPKLNLEANLIDPRTGEKFVYSIGQLDPDFEGKENIRGLYFVPLLGRELSFAEFTGLRFISVQDMNESRPGFRPENCSFGMNFTYPGDPFFWSDLAEAASLEIIRFDYTYDYVHESGNLYSLDAMDKDILLLPKLKSLGLNGFTFFPVDFLSFEKLDHLELGNMFTPELINIALVMYSFGKDTSEGNWAEYLTVLDLSEKIKIPEDGMYRSFYKNGQSLCEGQFTNGLPDGAWKFWYEDGSLCQERFYKMGEPDGTWNFRINEKYMHFPEESIIHSFTYRDGKLVNRKDYYYSHESMSCDLGEDGYQVMIVSEYRLQWKTESEVNIKKTNYSLNISPKNFTYRNSKFEIGDTLTGFSQEWDLHQEGWTYNRKIFCGSDELQYEWDLKGKPGQQAYYYRRKEIDKWSDHLSETIQVIDLKNRFWGYNESTRDSLGVLTPGEPKRVTIWHDQWPLDVF